MINPAAGSANVSALLLAAFLLAAGPALADQRVQVRIGMSMSQIKPYLDKECTALTLGGNTRGEQFITCQLPEGRLVTANLSAKDRITYSVYRETNDALSTERFGAEIAAELGFAGPGERCMVDRQPSLCWSGGTTNLWVYLKRDPAGRLSAFLADDEMAADDRR